MERRNLFKAAAAATLVTTAAPEVAHAAPAKFDQDDPRFAIAVLPDTQYLFDADSSDPAPLKETFSYLLEQRAEDNIAFLTHLGDVTEHGTEQEIVLAGQTFTKIDGKLPYSVLAGNHDIDGSKDDQRGDSPYLRVFGPERQSKSKTFLGTSKDGYNSAHLITAAGKKWLILALDWRISDSGIAWAKSIMNQHQNPTVVTTHDLAYADDAGKAYLSGNGQRLWDNLIKDNDQIFLTLNGHYWPPGRTTLKNAKGNDVHVHITNYQDRYYGGAGMIRLYRFDLGRNRIDVETFAPWFLARDPEKRTPLESETIELTGDVDRFSLEFDFDARFPEPKPAPRPAAQVVDRHTAAYWRFDQAGQSVADGATVRDLSGKGNHLTVRRLANSTAETLTVSEEHHVGAPAHASLRFDGGKGPDRGAILQTAGNAPLNSAKFLDGYTIEAFVKLPEPFVGDHSWMGILSWEGRAGDAGKHSGWSDLEPTCSLNISGERFLQYVLYSEVGDHNPTHWSHALPTGVWQHLAVVNDGKRSLVYVNGSKIARNPTQPAQGIATVGRPFTLGATSFDLKYGQGFYGWIGDVRITARALRPAQFLPGGHYR
ncbi:LamG-like jellyroll fold domain-containing protein [Paractinoplanes lichenicola]|uniref:LamG-like jellyroll fold domain-containing protein n=1 Tax=Paractinoplanes lichenicola TaxID=2802976 RepID=UPI0027DCC591|nr:LamG-like jellyroll fold domain-containing protein [Actinoplanes lichenicola]